MAAPPSRGKMAIMFRFTLPTALASLTCFCVAAATFRLMTLGGTYFGLWLIASITTAMLGFGVLVNEIGFSLFLAFVIVAIMVLLGPALFYALR
jgi:hypothetical protein